MKIRPAQLEDSASLAQVQVESYRSAYAQFFPPAYLARFTYDEQTQDWRDLIAKGKDILLVAETDAGEVVAYALGRRNKDEDFPFDGELVAMHVAAAYHRQGIGQQLLAKVAAGLAKRGCRSLMLWVLAENSARAFYDKLGGELIGEKHYTVEGWDIAEVAYGWRDIGTLTERQPGKDLPRAHAALR